MYTETEEFLTTEDFKVAGMSVPDEDVLAKINRPLVDESSQRSNLEHLLREETPIFYTKNGDPVYPQDSTGEYYQRHSVSRENNPLFYRHEQDVDRLAIDSIFNKLNKINEEGDIYYFPKKSLLSVKSPNIGRNGSHIVYYAVTDERLFARKTKEEVSKSGYEPIVGLGSDISFYKKESIGAPSKISTELTQGRIFYRSRSGSWKIGETYFNLTKAGVLGDFDKFFAFIKNSDQKAQESRLLGKR